MSKSKCPLCGGTVAYQGLNSLECRTVDCDNFCGEEEKPSVFPYMTDLVMKVSKPSNHAPNNPWASPRTHHKVMKKCQVAPPGQGTVPDLDNSKGD